MFWLLGCFDSLIYHVNKQLQTDMSICPLVPVLRLHALLGRQLLSAQAHHAHGGLPGESDPQGHLETIFLGRYFVMGVGFMKTAGGLSLVFLICTSKQHNLLPNQRCYNLQIQDKGLVLSFWF